MDLDAQAVAKAVTEVVAIAVLLEHVPGSVVDVTARDAGFCGGNARQLGFQHGVIDPTHLVTGLSDGHGAGHVGAIALIYTAKIHGHELPLLDGFGRGDGVRHTAVGAGGHDGREGVALRAVLHLEVGQLSGHFGLGDAGVEEIADFIEHLVGDVLRLLHDGQLLFRLGAAQFCDQLPRRNQLGALWERRLHLLPALHGQVLFLDAHPVQVVVCQHLTGQRQVVLLWGHHGHGGVGDGVLG